MSESDGGAAFPGDRYIEGDFGFMSLDERNCHPGMTLRDWFAGQALAGLSANPTAYKFSVETLAKWAYEQADAMIKTREAK